MAKESGLGMTVTIDDAAAAPQVITNDVTNLNFATPRGVYDWTGVDKLAPERGLGLADYQITLNGPFNDAANMSHAVFKTVCSTNVIRTTALALSGQTLTAEVAFSDYAFTRAQDGSFNWTATGANGSGGVPAWS